MTLNDTRMRWRTLQRSIANDHSDLNVIAGEHSVGGCGQVSQGMHAKYGLGLPKADGHLNCVVACQAVLNDHLDRR
ncbi:hypothetical protein ACG74X_11575 [Marivita sp. S0852]|uniref:hypothetical protein n=1 Tax=Marivita sp. S0852 TaxID=3373893 RepID=UPI00398291E3